MFGINPYLSWPQPTITTPTHIDEQPKERSPSQDDSGKDFSSHIKTTPSKKSSRVPPPGVSELVFHDSTDVTHTSIMTELVNPSTAPNLIIEHLDLTTFKITPCNIATAHNHKQCPLYHNAKDRKRSGTHYSSELCEYAERDDGLSCPNGEHCAKSHNRVEQLYRPEKYKTKFCSHFPNNIRNCEYGPYCSFAHSELDIVIELIHNYEYDDDFYMFYFKTVLCPFNLTQHDKAQCVYAHNWQDFRRKPNQLSYEPASCPTWKSTDYILNYQDGCPLSFECTKCHGWKELEYHPLNYRTKQCNTKNCQKGRDCPFYHSVREKRGVSTNVTQKFFKHHPRNRIIANTFKRRSDNMNPRHGQNEQYHRESTTGTSSQHKGSMDSSLNNFYLHFPPQLGGSNKPIDMRQGESNSKSRKLSEEVEAAKPVGYYRDSNQVSGKKNAFTEKYKRKLSNDEGFRPMWGNESNQDIYRKVVDFPVGSNQTTNGSIGDKKGLPATTSMFNTGEDRAKSGKNNAYEAPVSYYPQQQQQQQQQYPQPVQMDENLDREGFHEKYLFNILENDDL